MIHNHILLTGAGFSRNWGGYLATEVFEYLLGSVDDELRELLWRDKENELPFEDTLASLQSSYETNRAPQTEQNLRNLDSALQRMFGDMTHAFHQTPFESAGRPSESHGVANFLTKFDAIFTLNQDTLLETHYIGKVTAAAFPRCVPASPLVGANRPGFVKAYDTLTHGDLANRIELYKPDHDQLMVTPTLQPYFKLHGSMDLKASDREMMLILGGNKAENIEKYPILKWYHEEFQRRLCIADSRLMIIGYSFGDPHINETIAVGVGRGLKLFIIDTKGVDRLGKSTAYRQLKGSVIGASRRPLRDTLAGQDMVELNKVNRFFRTGRMAVTHHPAL
jgi:hypothetical protein